MFEWHIDGQEHLHQQKREDAQSQKLHKLVNTATMRVQFYIIVNL